MTPEQTPYSREEWLKHMTEEHTEFICSNCGRVFALGHFPWPWGRTDWKIMGMKLDREAGTVRILVQEDDGDEHDNWEAGLEPMITLDCRIERETVQTLDEWLEADQ